MDPAPRRRGRRGPVGLSGEPPGSALLGAQPVELLRPHPHPVVFLPKWRRKDGGSSKRPAARSVTHRPVCTGESSRSALPHSTGNPPRVATSAGQPVRPPVGPISAPTAEASLFVVRPRGGIALRCPPQRRHRPSLSAFIAQPGHPSAMLPRRRTFHVNAPRNPDIQARCSPEGGQSRPMVPLAPGPVVVAQGMATTATVTGAKVDLVHDGTASAEDVVGLQVCGATTCVDSTLDVAVVLSSTDDTPPRQLFGKGVPVDAPAGRRSCPPGHPGLGPSERPELPSPPRVGRIGV